MEEATRKNQEMAIKRKEDADHQKQHERDAKVREIQERAEKGRLDKLQRDEQLKAAQAAKRAQAQREIEEARR